MTQKLLIASHSDREIVGYFQVNPLDYEYDGPDPNNRIEPFLNRVVNDGPHYNGMIEDIDSSMDNIEMDDEDYLRWVKGFLNNTLPHLKYDLE